MRSVLLLFTTVSLSMTNMHAAVLTVDNVPGAGAQYASLQAAINAANAGDTIMVQPSPISYGNVIVSKQLNLIGPGHYLVNRENATVGVINLNTGSSNTLITGMHALQIKASASHVVHDVTIIRNHIMGTRLFTGGSGGSGNTDNWVIEGNVLIEADGCGGCLPVEVGAASDNWVIRHNIFITKTTGTSTPMFNRMSITTLLYHNIIIHRKPGGVFGGGSNESHDALLQNNIIWVTNSSITTVETNCTDCQWVHNLTYHSNGTLDTLPGGTNLNNIDPQFIQAAGPAFSYDNDYHCAPGSPGETGASDGGMLGVFGGGYLFRNHGEPVGIPRMLDMILDNVIIEQGNNSTVRVKAVGGAE